MYNKIKNPSTGRFVNTNSNLGKTIINNYLNILNTNQLGGTNPHTGKKWSSYNCNYDNEDACYDKGGINCKWVNATSKKKAYCRKSKSSSRKRGQKNWDKLTQRVQVGEVRDRLTEQEINNLLDKQSDLVTDNEYKKMHRFLENFRYNPDYISSFSGKMNKFNIPYNPNDAVWHQANDTLDEMVKYGQGL
jgi:hypothetical protein